MSTNQRMYYIDWLRVIAFGLLFVFHSFRMFDTYPWHLKNPETSISINYIIEFMHSWRMYIIFLVSGAGTYFAMKSKRQNFLNGRIQRLIIPYIFGVFILIPPQKFFEAIQQSGFEGNYFLFLTQLPNGLINENYGWNLLWTGYLGYHIWYLVYLFVQTILFLPLFKLILRCQNKVCEQSSKLFRSFYSFWLIIIPFVLLEFLLRPVFPQYLNWADFATFSLYFLFGFLLQINQKIILFIEKNAYKFLTIAIFCWSLYLINRSFLDNISIPEYTLNYFFSIILKNLNSISWVFAFIGLGKKFLDFNHRYLNDLNQGILPFYILHQTVIVIFGYFVVQWELSILEKFLIILSTSFIVTIGLYQIIRRNNTMRFFFGMKRMGIKPGKTSVFQEIPNQNE
jgi:glucans biosynthesis protein C